MMFRLVIVLGSALVFGCVGEIADQPSIEDETPILPIEPEEMEPPCPPGEVCVGSSQLLRLTVTQYRRTVRRVLGASIVIEDELIPEDHRLEGFRSNEGVAVGQRDVEVYARLAANVSAQAMGTPENVVLCDATVGLSCAMETIERIGEGLYRRPLSDDERANFTDFIVWALEEDAFETAVGDLIEVMLQSPHFLYQIERAGEEPTRLSPREVATRLAHYMFREGPDEELMAAADAGELNSAEGVVAWATRMREDARAEATMRQFHREWLGVDPIGHIDRTERGLSPELAEDMRREAEWFGAELTRNGGTLPELLTARWSIVNEPLAAHYGMDSQGTGFQRAEMGERSGILTLGAVLTVHSSSQAFASPVFRGLFVRNRLLCQELPEAPASALETAEERESELPEDSSDREKLHAITMTGSCASCHSLMNPIGHGLAAFDGVGRFRMRDSTGTLVDIAGELSSQGANATDVDGGSERDGRRRQLRRRS